MRPVFGETPKTTRGTQVLQQNFHVAYILPIQAVVTRLFAFMNKLAKLDQKYVWHPFTQMRDWMKREPIVVVGGDGAVLRDAKGKAYLDANSSIWTNLH